MNTNTSEIEAKGQLAKIAARKLAFLSTAIKNKALNDIADALITNESIILSANSLDYQDAKTSGMNTAMLDRLMLSSDRLGRFPGTCGL
jgi:glutamate-5-semialdehyde dehydrogenase